MSNGISNLIQADLAALTNAASNLASNTVAPAAQFAGHGDTQPAFSFAQSMKDAVSKVNEADASAAQKCPTSIPAPATTWSAPCCPARKLACPSRC